MAEARQPLISGNWKMHLNHFEAIQTVQKLAWLVPKEATEDVDVSIHPPFTDLRSIQTLIAADDLPFTLGAQHCHSEDTGAFTGEVSPVFLAGRAGAFSTFSGAGSAGSSTTASCLTSNSSSKFTEGS